MAKVHIFIVSWFGHHDYALSLATKLSVTVDRVTIIYSDPMIELPTLLNVELVKRPDTLYWTDKFQACLEAFQDDIMFVIHADCRCKDWDLLIHNCVQTMIANPVIGVWAPRIDNTYFSLEKTRIGYLDRYPFINIVAQTDGIVFALDKSISEKMKTASYEGNHFGWGIDWMFIIYTYSANKIAVVDDSIIVHHSENRGYPTDLARKEMGEFLTQFNLIESIHYRLLDSYVNNR